MHILCDYSLTFDALSYTFDHIWTNLLTQCTSVPVPVFCRFSISGIPTIKSAPKIPEKSDKKTAQPKLPESPKYNRRGATSHRGALVARPHPMPRHQASWETGTTPGAPLWPFFTLAEE